MKLLSLLLLVFSLPVLANQQKAHVADQPHGVGGRPNSWKGIITNFSRVRANKVAIQLTRSLGCRSVSSGKNKEAVAKVERDLQPRDTTEVVIHARGLDRLRAVAPVRPVVRRTDVHGDLVCLTEVMERVYEGNFGARDQVEFEFETPAGSDWRPLDVGWVTAETTPRLFSLSGLQNCATGEETEADRSSRLGTPVNTGFKIQPMGYMFRGHVIELPVNHLTNRQAGWHARGPNVWGAFTKNAGRLDVNFGPIDYQMNARTTRFQEAATVQVEGIQWGMNTGDVQNRFNERIRPLDAEIADRFTPAADRAQARRLRAALLANPTVSVHNNDQAVRPEGTELYLLYDSNQKVDEGRPVFYHTLNRERPAGLALTGNNPRNSPNYGQIA